MAISTRFVGKLGGGWRKVHDAGEVKGNELAYVRSQHTESFYKPDEYIRETGDIEIWAIAPPT